MIHGDCQERGFQLLSFGFKNVHQSWHFEVRP
jgi:hypothetical protein